MVVGNIYSFIDSLLERGWVGFIFVCKVIGCIMVWGSVDMGQFSGVVYFIVKGKCFEWCQFLIMVYSQYVIKFCMVAGIEKIVCWEWLKYYYVFFFEFYDSWVDECFFF